MSKYEFVCECNNPECSRKVRLTKDDLDDDMIDWLITRDSNEYLRHPNCPASYEELVQRTDKYLRVTIREEVTS